MVFAVVVVFGCVVVLLNSNSTAPGGCLEKESCVKCKLGNEKTSIHRKSTATLKRKKLWLENKRSEMKNSESRIPDIEWRNTVDQIKGAATVDEKIYLINTLSSVDSKELTALVLGNVANFVLKGSSD